MSSGPSDPDLPGTPGAARATGGAEHNQPEGARPHRNAANAVEEEASATAVAGFGRT